MTRATNSIHTIIECASRPMLALGCAAALIFSAPAWAEREISVEINKGQLVKLDRPASTVVISDPTTADVQVVSPKLLFIRGKKVGETSFDAIDDNDEPIYSATVEVTHDLAELDRAIKRVAPDADVSFRTIDGGLVASGFANTTAEADNIREVAQAYLGYNEKMVNMIKTNGSDQVMLKVKFVEMSRNDLKNLGLQLQNVSSHGNFGMQILQGPTNMPFFGPDPTKLYYRLPEDLLNRQSSTDTNLFLRYKDMYSVIDALETQGLASVLAEPSLVTTSGKAASFLAGGQFPVPAAGQNGTVTIQYQPFGVSLKFTPVVMAHDRISLTVNPEVSTLNFDNPIQVSGITYPILDTRQASAVVELGSGDSFMLAGLLQNQTSNTVNKFPGLGDLPVLGALFRSTAFQNNETELVILVTPYIVHPVAQSDKMQTPLDGYVPPSDLQRLLYGNLYQQQPLKDDKKWTDMPKLNGPGGFIEE